jgi:hypothetical protein
MIINQCEQKTETLTIITTIIILSDFRMSMKHTALPHSIDTVRRTLTQKWLPIVFVRLIQSQRYYYGKIWYRYSTTTNVIYFFPLIRNLLYYTCTCSITYILSLMTKSLPAFSILFSSSDGVGSVTKWFHNTEHAALATDATPAVYAICIKVCKRKCNYRSFLESYSHFWITVRALNQLREVLI